MNKTKKVLSIILITLLILSTVFTLIKKVGICASSSVIVVNSIPFPMGNGIGVSDINFTDDEVSAIINDLAQYNISPSQIPYILFHESFDQNHYKVLVYYVAPENPSIIPSVSYSLPSGLADEFTNYVITFHGYRAYYQIDATNHSAFLYTGSSQTDTSFSVGSLVNLSANGDYILKSGNLFGYPLYSYYDYGIKDSNDNLIFDYSSSGGGTDSPGFNHYFWQNYQDSIDDVDNNNNIWKPNYQNPSNQQGFWDNVMDFFNRSFKSLLGGISGATKTIGDYIVQFYNGTMDFWSRTIDTIFGWLSGLKDDTDDISEDTSDISGSVSSIDSRLSTFFGSFWSNFSDKLEDFLEDSWGHLPDIMKAPFRIAQWFSQHGLKNGEFDFMTLWHYLFDFDSTAALNTFSNNKYGDFVLDVRDFFNTFFGSISDQTASSRVFFVIPIGSHFGSDVGDVEINFDWYSSIRDNFLPYFMAFLYISVIWLFFKRLPDILRGVAGAESSFTDALPYDTHNTTYNGVGVFTSDTHVSNGGRNRVTYNSFKKL